MPDLVKKIEKKSSKKGLEANVKKGLAYALSFPATATSHFNEDGIDEFKSKLMFFVSVPSTTFLVIHFIMLLLPIFYKAKLDTTVTIRPLSTYYSSNRLDQFNNHSNTVDRPILKTFSSFYKYIYPKLGLESEIFNQTLFLETFGFVQFLEFDESSVLKEEANVTVKY